MLVGSAQLSPIATYERRLVGENTVTDIKRVADNEILPFAVYTISALRSVGLSESTAEELGIDYEVKTCDMSSWFSARFYAEIVAWSKVLIVKKSRRILGAHIIGHRGEELIHPFSLAMRCGISADQLSRGMYAFPTLTAEIKSML